MTQSTNLTSTTEVGNVIDTTGRWTSTTINNHIREVDDLMYIEMGKPMQGIVSDIGKIDSTVQVRYYVGEQPVYRIDRVFYGTTTKNELFEGSGWKASTTFGMVEILPVGSSGITPSVDNEIEIHYVPKIFNKVAQYRVIKRMLEDTDMTSAGETSKELQVIGMRLEEVEDLVRNKYTLQLSSSVRNYDGKYHVNTKRLIQDHDRNAYLGSTF